jgi:hypothetical protein
VCHIGKPIGIEGDPEKASSEPKKVINLSSEWFWAPKSIPSKGLSNRPLRMTEF